MAMGELIAQGAELELNLLRKKFRFRAITYRCAVRWHLCQEKSGLMLQRKRVRPPVHYDDDKRGLHRGGRHRIFENGKTKLPWGAEMIAGCCHFYARCPKVDCAPYRSE